GGVVADQVLPTGSGKSDQRVGRTGIELNAGADVAPIEGTGLVGADETAEDARVRHRGQSDAVGAVCSDHIAICHHERIDALRAADDHLTGADVDDSPLADEYAFPQISPGGAAIPVEADEIAQNVHGSRETAIGARSIRTYADAVF